MYCCGRGAECRHDVFNAVLRQGDNIHIAFDHDCRLRIANGAPRLKQAIQFATLFKQRCLRGVQIFRLALIDHPTTKADHVATLIEDRKHHPVPKPVVTLALIVVDHEATFGQRRGGVIFDRRLQSLPVVRCVAQAKFGGDFAGESAILEIVDCLGRFFKLTAIKIHRGRHDFAQ